MRNVIDIGLRVKTALRCDASGSNMNGRHRVAAGRSLKQTELQTDSYSANQHCVNWF